MLKREWARFADRCRWSWAGWLDGWRNEKSVRQWVYAWLASAALAFTLDLSPVERAVILSLGGFVIAAELVNTAIERTVDLVTKEHHDLAGRAKDAASAFVGLTAISVGIAWGIILFG
ncbi:diacylglycerol kinase [Aliiroseovarius lamellibrachiae]|uniref:diacylglycerol kinase n=1 Tax=Aliiroseovarius lamellibrachiae TaxID=1924933 RepID=UPI001BE0097B|nr:diacylglycerol kinase [Aliiroseovarius lamellibrachiae]MBT2129572.1 diacylglycerol kinase [Aliiroseovarius lamellibrachiae]